MSIIESTWRKASYSKAETNCVEAADTTSHGKAIRDTEHRTHFHLVVPTEEWVVLLRGVKSESL
ncbi:uncharacterized protein DUF397 [Murinocardiopsis flavida]|uniref:Uncharacterized protein DUF397 n=1 Tax=Murinocardiopsis flavida TaxID=645275 RepID=A0A2P8DL60_9ACTN|nr:DUF397 domain-containing protein [Murinocardiopsis flavida]PSK97956.1 uncharacterized protein DUF397 [Murinocardiopsis flavida]